jgi:hypothetical protein
MPASDVVVYEATMKEGWPGPQMERQFHAEDPLLEDLERQSPIDTLGKEGITTVHTGRAGGVSWVPPTGSKDLNQADGQKTNQAKWRYSRIADSIEIDSAVIQQVAGNSKATVDSADFEVKGTLSDMRKQLSRALFMDATGYIAQLGTNNTTKVLKLATTGAYGLGLEAVRQGWLVKGQVIDIGTAAEEAVIADGVEITAVGESETEPSITISGANVSTTGSHFVSIRNARAGALSYETNGLRLLASQTAELGGLKPENEPKWRGAFVDSTGGALTVARVKTGRRKVKTVGDKPDRAITSAKQVEVLDGELFVQQRYAPSDKKDMGEGEEVYVGNLKVSAHDDCPEGDFTFFRREHLFTLRTNAPYWLSEKFGGSILTPKPGTTFLYSTCEYFLQLCTSKRICIGQFRGLE